MTSTDIAELANDTSTQKRSSRTVLWIDAHDESVRKVRAFLQESGYACSPVTSSDAGFDFLTKHRPDLIILEYELPEMNGPAFLDEVTRNSKYKAVSDVPVIMLTDKNLDPDLRRRLFDRGLIACLQKPFGGHELLNVLENVFYLQELRLEGKEARRQERRTEYKYQDLIENASDLIFTLDLKGNFALINRRLPIITGWKRDDWLGKPFVEFVEPDHREVTQENFDSTIQGKSSVFEARVAHKGGRSIHFSIHINPIFERGKVAGCVGIARDITDKKQLEREIVALKNFNESIIQSMESGLITVDLERKITSFNSSAEQILGYAESDILGKPLDDVLGEEDCARLFPIIDDPAKGLLNREMQLTTRTGEAVYVGFTVTERFDAQKQKVGTIIAFKDITQIKQMQVEVQRMDRLASMGVLASGIAHEIRNPLAGIKTIAQTLEEEIEVTDPKREYLSRIVRQVNRMDDLLKTIFSYAKPRQPKRKSHQFQEIVQEVVALLDNRIRSQSVTYTESYDAELPRVYVDFYQIQQILINLFLNALDAMPDGGELRLEAVPTVTTLQRVDRRGRSFPVKHKSALYVQVKLQDSGIGIKPEALSSIFNPFFTTKPQGSGLGLSIVYRIMAEHQGDIQVESQANVGTIFRLLLPTEE